MSATKLNIFFRLNLTITIIITTLITTLITTKITTKITKLKELNRIALIFFLLLKIIYLFFHGQFLSFFLIVNKILLVKFWNDNFFMCTNYLNSLSLLKTAWV